MKLNKLALVGAFAVATLSSQAFAAQDATVNFNARLVAATCDISASKDLVSLGTHSTENLDTTKALSEANFNLVLNNCTKVYDDSANQTADATTVSILATGEALTGHSDMFADAQASQIGVKLAAGKAKTEVKPNIATEITDLKITGKNDYIIPVVAGLYATASDAVAQNLNVPVTFSVAYD
ncbi:fimbrial protein [Providencia alcalifaciens]|nr:MULTISPECIES: fimbrial protein [Providencia]EJD6083926.1 type 1 fimbrial protein [Providencia rettgeri]EJD6401671.1 type 1 fimbrial protein [Providencia rettgeri]EJD6585308.1 type 1 fimbrial protein [Providencia rettgeri]EJD6601932.1 type 1 fimbrial protein [Providencia rettgeri]EJD6615412.1 type 1 fimbrial protein [Providencia rettgeri]